MLHRIIIFEGKLNSLRSRFAFHVCLNGFEERGDVAGAKTASSSTLDQFEEESVFFEKRLRKNLHQIPGTKPE